MNTLRMKRLIVIASIAAATPLLYAQESTTAPSTPSAPENETGITTAAPNAPTAPEAVPENAPTIPQADAPANTDAAPSAPPIPQEIPANAEGAPDNAPSISQVPPTNVDVEGTLEDTPEEPADPPTNSDAANVSEDSDDAESSSRFWFGIPIVVSYQLPLSSAEYYRGYSFNTALKDIDIALGFQVMYSLFGDFIIPLSTFTIPDNSFSIGIELGLAIGLAQAITRVEHSIPEVHYDDDDEYDDDDSYEDIRYVTPTNDIVVVPLTSKYRLVASFNLGNIINLDLYGGVTISDIATDTLTIFYDIGLRSGIVLGPGTFFTEVAYVFPYAHCTSLKTFRGNRCDKFNQRTHNASNYHDNAINVGLGYRINLTP